MMQPRQQPGTRSLIVWLLSWALVFSPMLAGATASQMSVPDHPAMGEMPCHQTQASAERACPHCDENGLSLLCDCCDQAVSQTLLMSQGGAVCLTLELGETSQFILQTRSDPPPTLLFRPPIHS
ncbi:MAG: hypothetical protein ABW076_10835 [Candidatus Thiodiazotropha sp.]